MNLSDPKILSLTLMILLSTIGVIKTFNLLRRKEQGIGLNTLRILGLFIFTPFLLSLALFTEINREALLAIIGAIAGYVLSTTEK
jgi:hypothetical protein